MRNEIDFDIVTLKNLKRNFLKHFMRNFLKHFMSNFF